MQREGLLALLQVAKESGFHTAIETSGETSSTAIQQAEPITDLFLFDVKHIDPEQFRTITGGNLGRIMSNLRRLAPSGKVVARIPCIPEFNLDKITMSRIFDLVCSLGIREAHLLPYHTLAKDKYTNLGKAFGWPGESLSRENLIPFAELGENTGLVIKIGG